MHTDILFVSNTLASWSEISLIGRFFTNTVVSLTIAGILYRYFRHMANLASAITAVVALFIGAVIGFSALEPATRIFTVYHMPSFVVEAYSWPGGLNWFLSSFSRMAHQMGTLVLPLDHSVSDQLRVGTSVVFVGFWGLALFASVVAAAVMTLLVLAGVELFAGLLAGVVAGVGFGLKKGFPQGTRLWRKGAGPTSTGISE